MFCSKKDVIFFLDRIQIIRKTKKRGCLKSQFFCHLERSREMIVFDYQYISTPINVTVSSKISFLDTLVFGEKFFSETTLVFIFYKGMLPCFLSGRLTVLFSSMLNPFISFLRVSFGKITSSINPRCAAR